jgi:hypothetical protein
MILTPKLRHHLPSNKSFTNTYSLSGFALGLAATGTMGPAALPATSKAPTSATSKTGLIIYATTKLRYGELVYSMGFQASTLVGATQDVLPRANEDM